MRLRKCPRCELNYITEAEDYCKICKREMKGEGAAEEVEMCSVCNEAPCMPGKDVCLYCYREMNANEKSDNETDEVPTDPEDAMGIDSVSTMEEIIPEIDEDIPPREFDEIESDLSTEQMSEEEDEDEDEDEEEQ